MGIFKKATKFLLVFITITAWFLSGWPQVWENPPIPPKIREARAAVNFQAVGTAVSGTAAISPVWPAHQANDIGIMVIETGGEGTTLTPSGWTHVQGSPVIDVASTAGSKLHVLWKRAASSSEASVSTGDSGDHQVARIHTFRGVIETGNPWDVVSTGAKTTASTTATAVSVTTTVTDTLILLIVGRPNDNSSTTHFGVFTNANLTSITERGEAGSTSGHGGGFVLTTGNKATTGATGTSTSTKIASTTDTYITIALKPQPNTPSSLTVSQPDGMGDTVIAGQSYNIIYDLSDIEETVTVDFYYDADSSGLDGTAITGCQDQPEGTGVTCSWNTTGMTPGNYYVYGITNDGVNPQVSDYSPGVITINAAVASVTITSDGNVAYGIVAKGASKNTIDLSDIQTAKNDGNVTENFNIKGQNTSCPWILAGSAGADQYLHEFSINGGSGWTALTTSYQTLAAGIAVDGTQNFDLRITVPTQTNCYTQQSVDVTIQAVQQ